MVAALVTRLAIISLHLREEGRGEGRDLLDISCGGGLRGVQKGRGG